MPLIRVILHVDLDYFFAQVEERENPALIGKPVVVCVYSGRGEEGGAVSTANYVARGFGVKSGMPIAFAKRVLKDKDGVFLPVRHELYGMVSDRIMEVLRGYADGFEQGGIDEAYLDVTRRTNGDFDRARNLALQVKNAVKTTEKLTCSVGIGPNKLVAKMASDYQKPDGLTVIKPDQVQAFLAPLQAGKLYGVGRKTEKRLEDMGIKTVGDLAKTAVQSLVAVFGKAFGVYLHYASRGIDESPVQERGPAESYSHIATLKADTRDPEILLNETYRLCEAIHARLTQAGHSFTSVGVAAVMKDLSTVSRQKSLDAPADSLEALKENVKDLLTRLLKDTQLDVRRIGVKVGGFSDTHVKQRSLTEFTEKPSQ